MELLSEYNQNQILSRNKPASGDTTVDPNEETKMNENLQRKYFYKEPKKPTVNSFQNLTELLSIELSKKPERNTSVLSCQTRKNGQYTNNNKLIRKIGDDMKIATKQTEQNKRCSIEVEEYNDSNIQLIDLTNAGQKSSELILHENYKGNCTNDGKSKGDNKSLYDGGSSKLKLNNSGRE